MTSTETLENAVDKFLLKNFPQIIAHGGGFDILEADDDDGYVKIRLTGACSGCGISPMTIQAIRDRLPKEVDGVQMVSVDTGYADNVKR